MLKTKRNSPGPESKFAPESKFGAKKKRHLKRYKVWSIVEPVTETSGVRRFFRKKRVPVAGSAVPIQKKRRNKKRLIRNVEEALKMTAKGLYKRAHNAETPEERQQYIEWARARTRWEFEVGIRKLPPKRSAAA